MVAAIVVVTAFALVISFRAVIVTSSEHNRNAAGEAEIVNNIAFDVTDLTAWASSRDGSQVQEFQIEAFKSLLNDRILSTVGRPELSQLSWVSIGQPMFIKTRGPEDDDEDDDNNNSTSSSSSMRLFHFVSSGFYTYIQMLTPTHRQMLVKTAKDKYNIEITSAQIVNMILSNFNCMFQFVDQQGDNHLINGQVSNFHEFPLRMDFKARNNTDMRRAFEERLNEIGDNDLIFYCRISSQGRQKKTNSLMVEFQQLERTGLLDTLSGPSSATADREHAVYVSRDQLTALAVEMFSTLNIIEEYQIPSEEFSDKFIKDLLTQATVNQFSLVPIDAALETLSKFGLDMGDDLRPDKIKRDLGTLLVVERSGDKARIALNETKYGEFQRQADRKRGGNVAKRLGIDGSAEWAKTNAQRGPVSAETLSLADQLRDLNQASYKDLTWTLEGDRILPKSLNVARLAGSNFNRTQTFSRVRHQTYIAPFDRNISLYTRNLARQSSLSPPMSSATNGSGSTEFFSTAASQSVIRSMDAMKNELRNAIDDVATSVGQLRSFVSSQIHLTPSSQSGAGCTPVVSNVFAGEVSQQSSSSMTYRLISADPQRPLPTGRCVWGLATFNGKLYVGRTGSRELEIYDTATLNLLSHLPIADLGCLSDIASRPASSVMYLADNCYNQIIAVDQNGEHHHWSVGRYRPLSVSVTLSGSSTNALVLFDEAAFLREYTPTGELVREIQFPVSVQTPTHAIQLSTSRFAVSHASSNVADLHQVSMVDELGGLVQAFGSVRGSGSTGMSTPLRLVQVHGSVFVVDNHNDRVIMLNATSLAYIREVISVPTESDFLVRISLSDDGTRMFVAHNRFRMGSCIGGHIKTFDLAWL